MPNEIEAKYPVQDHPSIRRRLRGAGAVFLGTVIQTDRFYDRPDHRFRRSGCGLRLRSLKVLRSGAWNPDPRAEITFKGPVEANLKVKIRREIQTRLDDESAAHELLLACGLIQTFCYQKRRSSYRLGRCRVELDSLPLLGAFVEIEGPNESAIHAAREILRIQADHIPASYLQLLTQHAKAKKRSTEEITFEKYK
ncbi:MAG: class IV adenylate cyclase [Phycisphaerae bacterium]|nr:class IV adenylate cyclase [Phycisphaerae bacterium]